MKNTIFEGAATALVTPFDKNGNPDLEAYAALIDWQIKEGIDALVACGTTGESSTLSEKEYEEVVKTAVKACGGRVPMIVGTGSNNTAHAVERTKLAEELGADAALVVTPYYNKATQKGLIAHYEAIADASNLPVILYNVPSRTGVNIEPATCKILSQHEKIVAIKEASGNISKVAEILALAGDALDVYSGNDDQIVPIMSLGGKGVISVLSNPLPKKTAEMTALLLKGDYKAGAKLQLELLPLINALFCQVNPIPAKAAMSAMGYGENVLRLPLTALEEQYEEKLFALLREQGAELK
ncbi:MAG: 4-hydroxy-tetrahydrodipicolinate synthase [Clostridia bacterium]|nr:4-hydroxy-tetrahydrodipicolinate synthase [Clostridia bacterium]